MKILWLKRAVIDLKNLREYIAQDNPGAAGLVAKKILQSVSMLETHPHVGRPGRVPNTRELLISGYPYLIPYRVKNNEVVILRVFHTAMQW